MAKEDPLKYANLNLLSKKEKAAAERYGIKPSDYAFGRPGAGGIQKKNPMDFSAHVAAAANQDYDTRRTMEAAAMSGHSKSKKYAEGGFGGLEDVTKANNIMRRMHENDGNGCSFSSASDYAGVTFGQVNKERDNFAKQFATKDDLNTQQTLEQTATKSEPVKLSNRAESALGDYNFEQAPKSSAFQGNTKKPELAYDPNAGVKSNKAGGFLNDYKLDIQKGIAKDGTPGRGPNSIHNKY